MRNYNLLLWINTCMLLWLIYDDNKTRLMFSYLYDSTEERLFFYKEKL